MFDQLDQDQNSYLTLEEFTKGFEAFMGIENSCSQTSYTVNVSILFVIQSTYVQCWLTWLKVQRQGIK